MLITPPVSLRIDTPVAIVARSERVATILQQTHFFCTLASTARTNGGQIWTLQTYAGWSAYISYLTPKQIRGAVAMAVAGGLLLTRHYPGDNKGLYYRVNYAHLMATLEEARLPIPQWVQEQPTPDEYTAHVLLFDENDAPRDQAPAAHGAEAKQGETGEHVHQREKAPPGPPPPEADSAPSAPAQAAAPPVEGLAVGTRAVLIDEWVATLNAAWAEAHLAKNDHRLGMLLGMVQANALPVAVLQELLGTMKDQKTPVGSPVGWLTRMVQLRVAKGVRPGPMRDPVGQRAGHPVAVLPPDEAVPPPRFSVGQSSPRWEEVMALLEETIARPTFVTFLQEVKGVEDSPGRWRVVAPSTFSAQYLERRLQGSVRRALDRVMGSPQDVTFGVSERADE